ncbi:MAG: glycoside hydrolase family 43 protein [Opitutales bacterium]
MPALEDIRLRDPFVLPATEAEVYYLFGTTDPDCWGPTGIGFDAYRSRDLRHWDGPFPAFRPPARFWATHHFWAPEVHAHAGRYYMLASFKAEGRHRGTAVLVADEPLGPYHPHSDGPVTPPGWESLDGTLHWEDGRPWLVFCHEWTQLEDGAIAVLSLAPDLRAASGKALELFRGSAAPWSGESAQPGRHVTDGPWLHRMPDGTLLLLWSTIGESGYTLGCARSASGSVHGPWRQDPTPLFRRDGGHGMLFRTFEGQLALALHQPNQSPRERPRFFFVGEQKDRLDVRGPLFPSDDSDTAQARRGP